MNPWLWKDREKIFEKIDDCKNNTEKSSTIKIDERILRRYSMKKLYGHLIAQEITIYRLYYREDCMKRFCISLTEHTARCSWFLKKKNIIVDRKKTKVAPRCNLMLCL